jgi:PhnB protein
MPKRSLFDQLDQAITQLLAQPGTPVAAVDPEIAPLVRIASELRELPRTQFMERLKTDLERSTAMATTAEPLTAARTGAAPRIAFKSAAKAIEFYKAAFGAKETMRFAIGEQIPHAELMIGDSVILLTDEWPEGGRFSAETLGNSPVAMALSVPNVDAFFQHAVDAGAKVVIPVKDQFYGRREGTLRDPFGYLWSVSTITEEMSVEEMHRRMRANQPEPPKHSDVLPIPKGYRTVTPYPVVQDAPALIDFVKETFGAEEIFRSIGSAGGVHAEVRIGDSMMMLGGGGRDLTWRGESKPLAFHVYVPDCDAAYERALAAGGTSLSRPADQSYGERSATVVDAGGNYWYIATFKGDNYKWEGAPDVQPSLHPLRSEPVIGFLKRAFGAEEVGRYATPDGVIHHATLKIGDSHLELGDAHGPYQPMPGMFYLYVPDCDAVYRRALAAGATSISEPVDHPYGDRSGAVKDAFGNEWWIATHIKDVSA